MATTNLKKRIGISAAMGLSVGLVFITPTPAFAEGGFTSKIEQARVSFASRTWTDKNLDNTSTAVTLSGCKVNLGGRKPGTSELKSISLGLYSGNKFIGERSRTTCGTFSWGRLPAGDYRFSLQELNGDRPSNEKTHFFLDASTVEVKY